MELVNGVFEIAKEFMKDSSYVFINETAIEKVSNQINKTKLKFPDKNPTPTKKDILIELVASSINYCYFYGSSMIRPNGSSSSYLYECVYNAFYDYNERTKSSFVSSINTLISILSMKRFPLLEERISHLRQLQENAKGEFYVEFLIENHCNIEGCLNELITTFPGFASDIFLKRASLFFIQLYRKFGWFNEELKNFHVPADYQIPRVLEQHNCIGYNQELYSKIFREELIPKHSRMECEIRAATVLTIKQICDNTKWNVADVDSYFFNQRHNINKTFHLTITTDY